VGLFRPVLQGLWVWAAGVSSLVPVAAKIPWPRLAAKLYK